MHHPASAPAAAATIPELEGLRGLLAVWVMLGHWATSIAVSFQPLRQNFWDVQAVDVFIILSGFVITLLLTRGSKGYGAYIVRRWFRIAPAYLVVLLAAAWLLPWTGQVLDFLPSSGSMHAVRQDIHAATQAHFDAHLLLHLTLLHGLIPETLLPHAPYAFVGQAWSVSLEWQFYLLAPLFYVLIRRWRSRAYAVALILMLAGLVACNHFFNFGQAFVGTKLPLFALGAASCWLWHYSAARNLPFSLQRMRFISGALVGCCLASMQEALLGPALWLLVLHCLLVARTQGDSLEARLCVVLRWRPVQFLGRISYTLYLVHFLVMMGCVALLHPLALSPVPFATALLVLLMPTAILAAWVLSVLVERPAMQMGKKLSAAYERC